MIILRQGLFSNSWEDFEEQREFAISKEGIKKLVNDQIANLKSKMVSGKGGAEKSSVNKAVDDVYEKATKLKERALEKVQKMKKRAAEKAARGAEQEGLAKAPEPVVKNIAKKGLSRNAKIALGLGGGTLAAGGGVYLYNKYRNRNK